MLRGMKAIGKMVLPDSIAIYTIETVHRRPRLRTKYSECAKKTRDLDTIASRAVWRPPDDCTTL